MREICKNTAVQAQWFDLSTTNEAIANVEKYKMLTAVILNTKAEISYLLEDDILSLEYKDILERYKTEYTSVFKVRIIRDLG